MKRRTFIQLVGASTLGLPFVYSQLGSASGRAKPAPAVNRNRATLRLAFSPPEDEVIGVLARRAKGVYVLGGAVLGKAAGVEFPYLNLLVDSKAFSATKNDLFRFGVTPVSTPELPAHFIRFVHQGKAYSALNLELGTYVKQNVLGQKLKLMPLAHNFLVYSTQESWVLDPYAALQSRTARPAGFRMRVVQQPETTVAGLELCLAVAFDAALLGLEPPAGHARFEQEVLTSQVRKGDEATLVFHRVVSYFPDLMEVRGLEFTGKYLRSPLCLSAAAGGPGIDLRKVEASLRAVEKRGQEVSSSHLLAAINHEINQAAKGPALGTGLPDYLAARKLPMRRKDLLAELLAGTKSAAEV